MRRRGYVNEQKSGFLNIRIVYIVVLLLFCFSGVKSQAPVLESSSFLGGSGFDQVIRVLGDEEDNIYVLSNTTSDNFPDSAIENHKINGGADVALTKFSPFGKLLWSIYIGGRNTDLGTGLILKNGILIVSGHTKSPDFPTASGFQMSHSDTLSFDGFLTCLDTSGKILWSTFMGGKGNDLIHDMVAGPGGHFYIGGETSSDNFPLKKPYQGDFIIREGFLAKISFSGNVTWSTYWGGGDGYINSSEDEILHITLDNYENIFIAGFTRSYNFPLKNPFDNNFKGQARMFISTFDSSGGLRYSTFFGDPKGTFPTGIATHGNDIYITGFTGSKDFPVKNAYMPAKPGLNTEKSAILARLNTRSNRLIWSTYFGGTGGETFATALVLDPSGKLFFGGKTSSPNLPVKNYLQGNKNTTLGYDSWIAAFDTAGSLEWSTYFGGGTENILRTISLSSIYRLLIGGRTRSPDFPLLHPYQQTITGGNEGFFSQLSFDCGKPFPGDIIELCSGQKATIGKNTESGQTYSWFPVKGLDSPDIAQPGLLLENFHTSPDTLYYHLKATVNGCSRTDSIRVIVQPRLVPRFINTGVCLGEPVLFINKSNTGERLFWDLDGNPGTDFRDQDSIFFKYTSPGLYPARIKISSGNCSDSFSKNIRVYALPSQDFSYGLNCKEVSFLNLTTNYDSLKWLFPGGRISRDLNPVHYFRKGGTYTVRQVAFFKQCPDTLGMEIKLSIPRADFTYSDTLSCLPAKISFETTAKSDTYKWTLSNGQNFTGKTSFAYDFGDTGTYSMTLVIGNQNGCRDTVEKKDIIRITDSLTPLLTVNNRHVCQNETVHFKEGKSSADFWQWDFGDGQGKFTGNPVSHTFNKGGKNTLTLTLRRNSDQCILTRVFQDYIRVSVFPESSIGFDKQEGCVPLTLTFIDSGTADRHQWLIGGAAPVNGKTISHLFTSPGEHKVILISENDPGCRDSSVLKVLVHDTLSEKVGPPTLSATVKDQRVMVSWLSQKGAALYDIYKKQDENWNYFTSITDTVFFDQSPVYREKPVFYRIGARGFCDKVKTPGSISGTIHLKGYQEDAGPLILNWNTPKNNKFKVSHYEIQEKEGGEWEMLIKTRDTFATISEVSGVPCISVLAVGKYENEDMEVRSNRACFTLKPVILAPSAFSPNGDGINDHFVLFTSGIISINLQIYDRWGEKIFESHSEKNPWSGLINGKPLPEGIYTYQVKGISKDHGVVLQRGSVLLLH